MTIEAVVLNIMIRSNVNVIDQSDQGKNCCMKISIETFEIMIWFRLFPIFSVYNIIDQY